VSFSSTVSRTGDGDPDPLPVEETSPNIRPKALNSEHLAQVSRKVASKRRFGDALLLLFLLPFAAAIAPAIIIILSQVSGHITFCNEFSKHPRKQ